MGVAPDHADRMARARRALDGLSIGDAFGQRFFVAPDAIDSMISWRAAPPAPWRWTDDTHMALSIVDELDARGAIDPYSLATRFGARYREDSARGYGAGAHEILGAIAAGIGWELVSPRVFGGEGSKGNGAAMRAAPIGAYFAGDLGAAREQADLASVPTHAHPEGRAGAIAVAVAAAIASRGEGLDARAFLRAVSVHIPSGACADGIERAIELVDVRDVRAVADVLGNGSRVLAEDTVPLCLWCAARHQGDYPAAIWTTVSALGDRDTTCAIVGGIVALSARGTIPSAWREAREPLR